MSSEGGAKFSASLIHPITLQPSASSSEALDRSRDSAPQVERALGLTQRGNTSYKNLEAVQDKSAKMVK
ncbi:MAG: hypothetical protein Q9161_008455 [Pseudevernia consocians]